MLMSSSGFQAPSSPPYFDNSSPYHIFKIDEDGSSPAPAEAAFLNPHNGYYYSPLLPRAEVGAHEESGSEGSSPAAAAEAASSMAFPDLLHSSFTHNRRMIFPYKRNPGVKQQHQQHRRVVTMRDDPLQVYRFFEFHCQNCAQQWLSPLYRAKDGCFCRICHQFILPRGIRHSFTPYLGKETCYGKYLCHMCNRGWSSYKSLSNCADPCYNCGSLVYPYYQISHSVLYQKIHKNAFVAGPSTGKGFVPDLQDLDLSEVAAGLRGAHEDTERRGDGASLFESRRSSKQLGPRKITSISGIITSKQAMTSKKRLNCLSNVPFVHQSTQQVQRPLHLKPCYSEPVIRNGSCSTSIIA